jgi:hypothetical protein
MTATTGITVSCHTQSIAAAKANAITSAASAAITFPVCPVAERSLAAAVTRPVRRKPASRASPTRPSSPSVST